MAISAFVAGRTKRISHPDDTVEPRTVFIIQALPHRAVSYIRDQTYDGEKFTAGKAVDLTTQMGLLGIENLEDPNAPGTYIEIKKTVVNLGGDAKHACVAAPTLDLIPQAYYGWLTTEIQQFGRATEEALKKSDEQSSDLASTKDETAPNAPP